MKDEPGNSVDSELEWRGSFVQTVVARLEERKMA